MLFLFLTLTGLLDKPSSIQLTFFWPHGLNTEANIQVANCIWSA